MFVQDGNPLGVVNLQGDGTAQFSTSSLPVGTDHITADYEGASNYSPSSSPPFTLTVNATAQASVLTIDTSANPAVGGSTITLTGAVTSASGSGPTPTGTVSFYLAGNLLGTTTVGSNGSALFSTASFPVGVDIITGTYSGDSNYAPSSQRPRL